MATEASQEIIESLEGALELLSTAHAAAVEIHRDWHAQAINDAMRIVEDLRQRNEEYNPNMGAGPFPGVIRTPTGVARSVRVAVALDGTRAIYRMVGDQTTHRGTREYIIFAPGVGEFRPPAECVNVELMADAALYQFED